MRSTAATRARRRPKGASVRMQSRVACAEVGPCGAQARSRTERAQRHPGGRQREAGEHDRAGARRPSAGSCGPAADLGDRHGGALGLARPRAPRRTPPRTPPGRSRPRPAPGSWGSPSGVSSGVLDRRVRLLGACAATGSGAGSGVRCRRRGRGGRRDGGAAGVAPVSAAGAGAERPAARRPPGRGGTSSGASVGIDLERDAPTAPWRRPSRSGMSATGISGATRRRSARSAAAGA